MDLKDSKYGLLWLNKVLMQYIWGFVFALLYWVIGGLISLFFPQLNYHFITFNILLTFVLQCLFYYITTTFNWRLTITGIVLNLSLWLFELYLIERGGYMIHSSFVYTVFVGALLWVTNKIIIDRIFRYILKDKSYPS